MLTLPALGKLRVDTAFGGDSFVIVDAADLGFDLVPDEARTLAKLGSEISNAATAQLGFIHPTNPDWRHISFCLFAGPLVKTAQGWETRHAVAIQPGKIDRSPTGTAVSARMALLAAQEKMQTGDRLTATSIIDSRFDGQIFKETEIGGQPAIVPEISGRAWITGTHQHMLDPDDPWPTGYRIKDTWGQN